MLNKKFLIIGHPRSGTGYMAHLLNLAGYDVGHEVMGKDGISSWLFSVNAPQPWRNPKARGLRRWDYHFEKIIHVIRHPVDVISSTAYTETDPRSLSFRRKFIDIPDTDNLAMAAYSFIRWTTLILRQEVTLRVKVEEASKELQNKLGVPVPLSVDRVNQRNHPMISLDDILECIGYDTEDSRQLQYIMKRFGYY